MLPDRTKSRACSHWGWHRTRKASWIRTPAESRASIRVSASPAFNATGFSHSTCLPALAAAIESGTCRWFGSGLYTASMSGPASNFADEP